MPLILLVENYIKLVTICVIEICFINYYKSVDISVIQLQVSLK